MTQKATMDWYWVSAKVPEKSRSAARFPQGSRKSENIQRAPLQRIREAMHQLVGPESAVALFFSHVENFRGLKPEPIRGHKEWGDVADKPQRRRVVSKCGRVPYVMETLEESVQDGICIDILMRPEVQARAQAA